VTCKKEDGKMAKANGQVKVPSEYFLRMAKHDYRNHKNALAREFYQNSVDAGAKKIEVVVEDKERIVTITDNGCGMNRHVLVEKLLVLGGSHKKDGSVGAFGKAKELLFCAWDWYQIDTWTDGKMIRVKGKGADYTIETVKRCEGSGTIVQIKIPESENLYEIEEAFKLIARRMQVKSKILVNGVEAQCIRKRGFAVRTVEGLGVIHQTKCRSYPYMYVRIDGMWMYSTYVGENVGELVMELSRSSLDLMTSNRDGLKHEAAAKMESVVKDLIVNPEQSLKPEEEMVEGTIYGEGKVRVQETDIEELYHDIELTPPPIEEIRDFLTMHDGAPAEIADVHCEMLHEEASNSKTDWEELVGLTKLAGVKPDFFVRTPKKKTKKVEKYLNSKNAPTIAKIWTETVRQILIDNRLFIDFTPGFIFEDAVEAQLRIKGDDHCVLLNPIVTGKMTPRWAFVEELKDRAIHEIAHLIVDDHNEKFVNTMARLRRKTNTKTSAKVFRRICKI
jgi:hypothetical protein